jgi:hypothetical protein
VPWSYVTVLILPATLLSACAAGVELSSEDAELNALRGIEYETQRLVAAEPQALIASQGRARREGSTLILTQPSGTSLRLTNGSGDCTFTAVDCLHYIFGASLPRRHAFLVAGKRYEGGDWFLIDDRTGRRTTLGAVPTFDESGKLLLVQTVDSAYGGFYGLQIWKRTADSATLEWQHSLSWNAPEFHGREPPLCPALTIALDAKWSGLDRIDFRLKSLPFDDCPEAYWPASVRHDRDHWTLTTQWPRMPPASDAVVGGRM